MRIESKIIKINGVEFELDLSTPEEIVDLKLNIISFNQYVNEIDSSELSEFDKQVRRECALCILLNNVLGLGADKKIFRGYIDQYISYSVILQFNKEVKKLLKDNKGILIEFPRKKER